MELELVLKKELLQSPLTVGKLTGVFKRSRAI